MRSGACSGIDGEVMGSFLMWKEREQKQMQNDMIKVFKSAAWLSRNLA